MNNKTWRNPDPSYFPCSPFHLLVHSDMLHLKETISHHKCILTTCLPHCIHQTVQSSALSAVTVKNTGSAFQHNVLLDMGGSRIFIHFFFGGGQVISCSILNYGNLTFLKLNILYMLNFPGCGGGGGWSAPLLFDSSLILQNHIKVLSYKHKFTCSCTTIFKGWSCLTQLCFLLKIYKTDK